MDKKDKIKMKNKLLLAATATLVGCSLAVFSLENDHSTVQAVTVKTQGSWWLNQTKRMGGSNIPAPYWQVRTPYPPYNPYFRGAGHR